ncbi:glycosyl transferase [Mycolicibacterium agri]|uniref:Glycosyl transferase n=2 Tax=Mycolicibacterium agri TaxID=36811 RepID=A0A2A7NGV8_MYCAG|nr:glycosyl transferase [Mycolicibacterium agri]
MKSSVTAVIATMGRPSLMQAVQSILDQTHPVKEIMVVAGTDARIRVPADDRIRVLRNDDAGGPAHSRQLGIEAASGSVIALLDDDDVWSPTKIARQLAAADALDTDHWVVSSRMLVQGPGSRRRMWPRRLIEPGESVAEYLFRFDGLSVGNANLQTSTLCFPTALARCVRWGEIDDEPHDEPSWLIRAQRTIPTLHVVQLPDALSVYNITGPSASRQSIDRTDTYISWGLQHLGMESPRILGDYLCTSPVSAAVSARSLTGVRRAVSSAVRHGAPGPFAMTYAALNALRIVLRTADWAIRR